MHSMLCNALYLLHFCSQHSAVNNMLALQCIGPLTPQPIGHRVMLHIGKKIESVWKERGLTKVYFAEKIGMHRNTLDTLFTQVGCDTVLLMKISKVLDFNFFELLKNDFDSRIASTPPTVSEPLQPYQAKPSTMRIIVELDSENSEQKAAAIDMLEILNSRRKGKGK